jgi:hypothetical protein
VQIGDEIIRLVTVLEIDILPDRGKVIPPVDSAGRLNAGKDTHGSIGGSFGRFGLDCDV